eukprot:84712_1
MGNDFDFNVLLNEAQKTKYHLPCTADPDVYAIIIYNSNYIKDIFVKGFKTECNRMKDIDLRCNHHNYKSINDFCRNVEICRRRGLKQKGEFEEDKFTDLVGNGFCRKCSINIASQLMIITGYDTFINNRIAEFDTNDWDSKLCYFVNCMQYLSTAKFIFKQSNLWTMMMSCINTLILDTTQRRKFNMETRRNFHNMTTLLFQILRNIKIMTKRHWQLIVEHQICLMQWLSFIKLELQYAQFGTICFGTKCMYCLLVLVTYALYNVKSESLQIIKDTHNFKGLKQWFDNIKLIKYKAKENLDASTGQYYDYYYILNSFLSLENKSNLINLYEKFEMAAFHVYRKKSATIQCQNECCKRTKGYTNQKFYKCASCQVSRYCSKRCQKFDWKHSKHKRICVTLRKIRIQTQKQTKTILIQCCTQS